MGAPERRGFEELLEMSRGEVLGFSDGAFRDFVLDVVGKDIADAKYARNEGATADRLRAFWLLEPADLVADLLDALLDRAEREVGAERSLVAGCRQTVGRLRRGDFTREPSPEGREFDRVAGSVRASIEANAPEVGLDRLHSFLSGYIRGLAGREGLNPAPATPLNDLFEEVVGALRRRGAIESRMAERILDSAISTLEWFDEVRSHRAFGGDDPLLSYNEALFVFDHVSSVIRFLATVADPPSGAVPDAEVPRREP